MREMEKAGLVQRRTQAKRKVGDKTEKMAHLAMKPEDAMALVTPRRKTAPMRYAVTELLCGLGSAGTKELCYFTGASMQTLRSLAKSGAITLEEQEVFRRVLPPEGELRPLSQLNHQQQRACEGLSALLNTKKPQAALLCGVTGSGKTQVYLHLIRQVDGGFVATVVKVEPAGELLPGVKGQQIQFQQQLRGAVLYYPEEVHQLTFNVVVDLELAGFLAQEHSAAAAEDLM